MINKIDKNANRIKRHVKIRHDLAGTTKRPRLCVYRSLNHIYAQIVDDSKGVTLVACNTTQKEVAAKVKDMTNKEQARFVGEEIARLAKKKKITEVVFDRGGYLYTGRVKELADGARAAGLEF
ncbi:MAG: 50S ribosomal protein L18 [Clostridia bacterium]|nr:50S ribosomal protein L18 [Clostridia bacterium]